MSDKKSRTVSLLLIPFFCKTMALLKRKYSSNDDSDSESASQRSSGGVYSDGEVDIASALTGRKNSGKGKERSVAGSEDEDDFEELEKLIRESVTKRDKKDGTKLLKMTKKKANITKGEVGGGSFQSMGIHFS